MEIHIAGKYDSKTIVFSQDKSFGGRKLKSESADLFHSIDKMLLGTIKKESYKVIATRLRKKIPKFADMSQG